MKGDHFVYCFFYYDTFSISLLLETIADHVNNTLQILLEEVKVSEQILDLVFYMLIVLAGYEKVLVIFFCMLPLFLIIILDK